MPCVFEIPNKEIAVRITSYILLCPLLTHVKEITMYTVQRHHVLPEGCARLTRNSNMHFLSHGLSHSTKTPSLLHDLNRGRSERSRLWRAQLLDGGRLRCLGRRAETTRLAVVCLLHWTCHVHHGGRMIDAIHESSIQLRISSFYQAWEQRVKRSRCLPSEAKQIAIVVFGENSRGGLFLR